MTLAQPSSSVDRLAHRVIRPGPYHIHTHSDSMRMPSPPSSFLSLPHNSALWIAEWYGVHVNRRRTGKVGGFFTPPIRFYGTESTATMLPAPSERLKKRELNILAWNMGAVRWMILGAFFILERGFLKMIALMLFSSALCHSTEILSIQSSTKKLS